MPQRPLISRKTVNVAAWSLLASMALALTLIACGPGPTTGPTPTGDVTITVTVVGDGRATFDAADFTCSSGTCTLMVDEGTDVSLAAVPNAGRVLVAWDGPCSPFADTCAWEANEDVGVTVTFAPHALRFDLQGDGEGSFAINAAGDVTECRDACGVALQQPLAVTIIYDAEGSTRTTLGLWIGTCADETATYCLVNVAGVTTIGMTWRHPPIAADQVYLTMQETLLTVAAPGVLADVDDTPGDTHTASLSTQPANGTVVLAADGSFTYEPNAGFTGDDEFTFRVTDAFGNTDVGTATVTVSLLPTLAVVTSGDGSGTVTSVPTGIDTADGDTSASFAEGTEIELTAAPDENSDFTGWTGVTCDDGNDADTCTFTFTTSTTVTAAFTPITDTLTVETSGDGTGNVTSTPTGIDLDANASTATFTRGTEIELTATADDGSDFDGWTDVTCNEGNTNEICTFTITDNTTVTAQFTVSTPTPITDTLTVETSGDGTGNVTSTPTGIDLDADASTATFTRGTEIELTATADDGSDFDGWTDVTCDEGNTNEICTFTITDNTTVTATFTPITPPVNDNTLTVTTSGDGSGSVTSSPPGINLRDGDTTQTATFTHGTEIELTAHPDSDSDLDEWSGVICDEGDDEDTCTFILIQDTTVDAEFDD